METQHDLERIAALEHITVIDLRRVSDIDHQMGKHDGWKNVRI